MGLIKILQIDNLQVKIYSDRQNLGKYAANDVVERMVQLLKQKTEINMVFAAAPSQDELLETLATFDWLEWSRVNAFHLDEYIGMDRQAPQRFSNYLKTNIFNKLSFKSVNYLGDNKLEIEDECMRYSQLLKDYPLDIACIGIGENGHIAFNDPHVADFNDKNLVKMVKLDNKCKKQQVRDGCFESFELVPQYALSLTIPAILSAKYIYCVVPGVSKGKAVRNTIEGCINERCPASILRTHTNSILYLDKDSAQFLKEQEYYN